MIRRPIGAKAGQWAAAPWQRRRMWTARLLPVLLLVGLLAVALVKCWLLTQGLGADGRSTYTWARWQYDEGSRFDNTWPTWATDYALCALTGVQAARIRSGGGDSELRSRAWVLLLMYSASTCLGGLAHQLHDGTPDGLNTGAFRLVWTLVVGLTAAAGGALGLIGTELLRLGLEQPSAPCLARRVSVEALLWPPRRWRLQRRTALKPAPHVTAVAVPGADGCAPRRPVKPVADVVPDTTWICWIAALAAAVAVGAFSCARPACDVFIAGCSQTLPTFYLQLVLLSRRRELLSAGLPSTAWVLLQVGLIGNAPLIFAYPSLVQRSGLELGAINALLHTVLGFSWGLQGFGLERVCRLVDVQDDGSERSWGA